MREEKERLEGWEGAGKRHKSEFSSLFAIAILCATQAKPASLGFHSRVRHW